MILEIENTGHDDIPPQNSIACTRIIEEKTEILEIEIMVTIKPDIKDGMGDCTAIAKPRGLSRCSNYSADKNHSILSISHTSY